MDRISFKNFHDGVEKVLVDDDGSNLLFCLVYKEGNGKSVQFFIILFFGLFWSPRVIYVI